MLKEIIYDLIRYYYKPQAAAVEKELKQILELAVADSIDSCRAISEILTLVRKDESIEESSLVKFLALCASLGLHD